MKSACSIYDDNIYTSVFCSSNCIKGYGSRI